MKGAIIIPTTDKAFPTLAPAVRLYGKQGYTIVLAVNGCTAEQALAVEDQWELEAFVHVVFAGEKANPYPARNEGLRYAFSVLKVDACLLTDSDCTPEEGFFEALPKYLHKNAMVAGRTKTAIPTCGKYDTRHFGWLAEKDFECYDGFTPPTFTVGSNMIVGAEVFKILGRMREGLISGGDGEYGERHEALIGPVTVADDLIVTKTVYTMDFMGICEKQLRRAKCAPSKYRPSEIKTLQGLTAALNRHLDLLVGVKEVDELERDYDKFVDALFQVMMWYGHLGNHLDKQ